MKLIINLSAISAALLLLGACKPSDSALPPIGEDSWTVVLVPDTQDATRDFPKIVEKQGQWIADNKEARNIHFVLQAGDITYRNTHPEWLNAHKAFLPIREAKIPLVLVPGNHDLGPWGSSRTRSTFMNEYFSWADTSRWAKKRGYFKTSRLENTYQTFDTPWGPFLVIGVEFFPRDAVIEWADKLAKRFSDHHVILLTHAYLFHDDTRYHSAGKGDSQEAWMGRYGLSKLPEGANDGEMIWQKLVSRNPNFLFVFSGHVLGDGTGYLVSKGEQGNEVHQLMANYQTGVKPDRGPGGGGYMRLLEFMPDRQTIKVTAYSPWFDRVINEPDQSFVIRLSEPLKKLEPKAK